VEKTVCGGVGENIADVKKLRGSQTKREDILASGGKKKSWDEKGSVGTSRPVLPTLNNTPRQNPGQGEEKERQNIMAPKVER